jgi:hypothetical protein
MFSVPHWPYMPVPQTKEVTHARTYLVNDGYLVYQVIRQTAVRIFLIWNGFWQFTAEVWCISSTER